MRCVYCLSIMLVLVSTDLVRADDPPRRTTRVASGPVRSGLEEAPQEASLTLKPAAVSPVTRPSLARPTLLEPLSLVEGVGRGLVACFEVHVEQAAAWQLVVQEIDGPVAQIFEGQGSPPSRIPWDGRLLDGGLAWCGTDYAYYVAFVDSSGAVDEMDGTAFTLPAYSRQEEEGISFLVPGRRLVPGGRGDPVAAAVAGLESVAKQLNQDGGLSAVRIEVLARDETTAMTLGETIRTALADLLVAGDRAVDLYVGTAAAAPPDGTVLITTVPLSNPPS